MNFIAMRKPLWLNSRYIWTGALVCLPWLALLSYLANVSWFLTDDAFISFRYVRNLVEGHGLVFNLGERVEGYSNFLWVLKLAALWGMFGLRPEQVAPWLSVACTVGTLAAMLWWVARLPGLRYRGLMAWMALGLVCSSATFAVWTSGGGLETRMFTFFVVSAVVCLSLYGTDCRGLLTAALFLAGAALTRPEGPLIAACCFGWFVVARMVKTGRIRVEWHALAYLICPFIALVAAHFLFRYAYYGEWLPNTYYAKHVRPWYDMGFRYLLAAALETGLYLLLPLTFLSLIKGWRTRRNLTYALPLLCIISHMAYIARVGGDHFEYRPLDFYWPLLAVPTAEGLVHLGAWISAVGRWLSGSRNRFFGVVRSFPFRSFAPPVNLISAVIFFLPVSFYSNALQAALLFEGAKIDTYVNKTHIALREENANWLLVVPGMPMLTTTSDHLTTQLIRQGIGMRWVEHRNFAAVRIRTWQPYENMERGTIPHDAVTALWTIGIPSYYVPDLTVIDKYGLTDATIARNPITPPNYKRGMAHDRRPPSGYLEKRGVNFTIHPALHKAQALRRARYAVKVAHDLWMPFDSPDDQWVIERFAGRALHTASHPTDPSANYLRYDAKHYVGDRFLQHFEDGFGAWWLEGDAVTNHSQHAHYSGQQPINGNIGPGFLTSYHPSKGDRVTGRALSPEFIATTDQLLSLLIAGGKGEGVGVRLLADDEQVAVWRGQNTEHFERVIYPLTDVAGKRLQLELFDRETGGWGHIMLDHVILLRRQPKEHE